MVDDDTWSWGVPWAERKEEEEETTCGVCLRLGVLVYCDGAYQEIITVSGC